MAVGMEMGLGPGHIVLVGDPTPPWKKGYSPPPIFGPCLLWTNGWMHQDGTWYEGRCQPRQHCVSWGPSSTSPKRGTAPTTFQPMSLVPKWLDGSRCHVVRR